MIWEIALFHKVTLLFHQVPFNPSTLPSIFFLDPPSSSQLTINTAIVYMHRFYMHHSFTKFHRNVSIQGDLLACRTIFTSRSIHELFRLGASLKIPSFLFFLLLYFQIISPTTLFLAAKVEEQPRKLEHVIKVAHACLNPLEPPLDAKSNVSSGCCACCGFEATFPLHMCYWSCVSSPFAPYEGLCSGLLSVCTKHPHLSALRRAKEASVMSFGKLKPLVRGFD